MYVKNYCNNSFRAHRWHFTGTVLILPRNIYFVDPNYQGFCQYDCTMDHGYYKNEDVVWLLMGQLSTRDTEMNNYKMLP